MHKQCTSPNLLNIGCILAALLTHSQLLADAPRQATPVSELADELERTEGGQAIKFPKRAVEWIHITDLVPHQPIWRAFTEVQVGVNKSYASSACS